MPIILTAQQKIKLFEALNYLNMEELTKLCKIYKLSIQGKKGQIIERLKYFIDTGKIMNQPPLPAVSKAKNKDAIELKANALILSGRYKNDEHTRNFMKQIVGEHFHFTAFGQDWIKAKWYAGTPPTYKEFAEAWQTEYLRRKDKNYKAAPKAEWAYLNFLQKYMLDHPQCSKSELSTAWEKLRTEKVNYTFKSLNLLL